MSQPVPAPRLPTAGPSRPQPAPAASSVAERKLRTWAVLSAVNQGLHRAGWLALGVGGR